MEKEIKNKINKFEDYIGFRLDREDITFESEKSHDETFSYTLCKRFFGKEKKLKEGVKMGKSILTKLFKLEKNQKKIGSLCSVLGNMYYILGDYKRSTHYFMKSLNYNRINITNWVELIFSLKVLGQTKIFEALIFNLQEAYNTGKKEPEKTIDQNYLENFINKLKQD